MDILNTLYDTQRCSNPNRGSKNMIKIFNFVCLLLSTVSSVYFAGTCIRQFIDNLIDSIKFSLPHYIPLDVVTIRWIVELNGLIIIHET